MRCLDNGVEDKEEGEEEVVVIVVKVAVGDIGDKMGRSTMVDSDEDLDKIGILSSAGCDTTGGFDSFASCESELINLTSECAEAFVMAV